MKAPAQRASLRGQHSRVLEELGSEICSGRLAPEQVITLEEMETRYGVSRSVARETIRVLESMRLVISRRRVGVVVLPPEEWNLFDPQIIHWRLASADRVSQLESLVELRTAIEPEAARLAATRASSAEVSDLIGLAGQLWAAGEEGDADRFLALDVKFHAAVLTYSGNPMFSRLDSLIGEILVSRTEYGLVPERPDPVALQRHVDVANAIQRRDPEVAHATMRSILVQTISEIGTLAAGADEAS
ncbi:FCD domain-containing protein [Herbiconiux moechotypicola]|uniref:FCD domain-containing protein n=2 Tax=Herbiconiux moechotypicola TaxID=637393 RepID=A0ABN3DC15_9MICO